MLIWSGKNYGHRQGKAGNLILHGNPGTSLLRPLFWKWFVRELFWDDSLRSVLSRLFENDTLMVIFPSSPTRGAENVVFLSPEQHWQQSWIQPGRLCWKLTMSLWPRTHWQQSWPYRQQSWTHLHHSCCHAELRKLDLEVTARHLNEVEAVQHVHLTNIPVWFGLLDDI